MYKIFLIGTSDNGLVLQSQTLLGQCTLLVGTERLQNLVEQFNGRRIPVAPLATAFSATREALQTGNVAILASGDPLFYGIGKRILEEFGCDRVEIHPALSAVQRAAARFKISWDDGRIISLHGRSHHHIPGLLLLHHKAFVFTDKNNSPDIIARKILNYLELIGDKGQIGKNLRVHVVEDIDLESEKIFRGSLAETGKRRFSALNIFCLTREKKTQSGLLHREFGLGLTEDEICHSRGLITKSEVRAVTLHQLRLPRTGVFWDVGGGSGSISIEAARTNPGLTVYTIEHKMEELENIKENIRRFHCFNVVPVFGRAPEMLQDLPAPDRVFIGGSSGALRQIIHIAAAQLPEKGRLVVNGVIEKTTRTAPAAMAECGLSVSRSLIRVSRSTFGDENDNNTQHFNPITVITGKK
ncbi:precorrin-6Y-methylase [Desulfomarina profundi]|uniref:Precorrin-6Y-methylase n=1 Tax=Desulfomarina profundi TaxID=2772557 RepID=A0A8D5FF37_9BACT|nr:precorrin-6y C5,15-methyltransferase (decarboxylating) subunit CbiE [Desulfomarina profundi]BCL60492.1 precorrin-6Y-methylase [Desulfomarina profundi]